MFHIHTAVIGFEIFVSRYLPDFRVGCERVSCHSAFGAVLLAALGFCFRGSLLDLTARFAVRSKSCACSACVWTRSQLMLDGSRTLSTGLASLRNTLSVSLVSTVPRWHAFGPPSFSNTGNQAQPEPRKSVLRPPGGTPFQAKTAAAPRGPPRLPGWHDLRTRSD